MNAPELLSHRSWPELLYHVLAHVSGSAQLPASVYDSVYVAYAQTLLGPAGARPLGEDAHVLARVLPTHELLAQAQLLAPLFEDADAASACATTDLDALEPSQVSRPELLPALRAVGVPVEVLRCAAELEREALASLPPVAFDEAELLEAVAAAAPAAPALSHHALLPLRSLRLRGRLFGREIWIGAPCADTELTAAHVAWQACHEATVGEVTSLQRDRELPMPERQQEHLAVVLLAQRARATGLGQQHAGWLAHLGSGAPSIDPASLDEAGRQLLAACQSCT